MDFVSDHFDVIVLLITNVLALFVKPPRLGGRND